MRIRTLEFPAGFDSAQQFVVGQFVWQLDLQTQALVRSTEALGPPELEWQPRPGVNTVGMLLAHIAVAEFWWLGVIPRGVPSAAQEPEVERRFVRELGIAMEDDGLPLPKDGRHPASLRGNPASFYHTLLQRAREQTVETVRNWRDAELTTEHATAGSPVSRHWILYHVLEHQAAHTGQIRLLGRMLDLHGASADGH